MNRFSGWLAVVALGVAALVAGCGSSHRTTTAHDIGAVGVPPTFSEELSAVCISSDQLRVRLGRRKWAAEEQGYLRKRRALTPPQSEQATYAKFLATFQTVIDGFGANKAAALNAAIENQKLRHQLHAPACGLPDVAF